MADYREIAHKYLENGLTTIPVGADKQPRINWIKFQQRHITKEEIEMYFKDCHSIAVLTGGPNGLECIDLDLKYDLTGDLQSRFKDRCDTDILKKLWVQKTKSDGYHWVYKTKISEPNMQLARRPTTAYERHKTYMEAFEDPKCRDLSAKIAAQDKCRVLLETRGGIVENDAPASKGYFLVAPSPGYTYVYGKLTELTDQERNHLIETAREFNEFTQAKKNYKKDSYERNDQNNPFKNFNEQGDILGLLLDHGWEEVSNNGKYCRLRRPGKPDSKSSALLDLETKIFNVFSTSTMFNPGTAYSGSDLFIELEAEGDTSLAHSLLKERGY